MASADMQDPKTSYGEAVVNGMLKEEKVEAKTKAQLSPQHDHVLKTFRLLVGDLCQQFKGGHPGGAMGMAAIGVALWKYVMRYAPHHPEFFNRDRFVLSNGHTCVFQYILLHLTGYKDMTLDQLKSYHSTRPDGLCPGHPEIEHEGIEVTTGPLGQGIANAVGMAAASKHLGAIFNRPGFDIVSNHTWCSVGDACLQEGVGLEAISLAGHWRLDNLTVIYDNNQVTCDGNVDVVNTEDVNAKMEACGWEVIDVMDGCFDVEGLIAAMEKAKEIKEKPTFINVRTIIGVGSAVAGDAVAHGVALPAGDVENMKRAYGFDPEKSFFISQEVRDFFADIIPRGDKLVREWESLVQSYGKEYPDLASDLRSRIDGALPADWRSLIPSSFPSDDTPTRASSGKIHSSLAQGIPALLTGTADLTPSVNLQSSHQTRFLPPSFSPSTGGQGSFAGRYIHYGIREHAMASVANGLAAFQHPESNPAGAIIPVTSSFFMFYLYAAPAVRMGALMRLRVVHIATHDSIGMGEDGPTHQPLELAALFRAMPILLYIRPADAEECAGAWLVALDERRSPGPVIISTSRHKVPQFAPLTDRHKVGRGAYVLREPETEGPADVTLIGVGAELRLAIEIADYLSKPGPASSGGEEGTVITNGEAPPPPPPPQQQQQHPRVPLRVRVVSFPCQRLFDRQPLDYRRTVLRRHDGAPAIAIEPYVAFGWERYADAAVCMSTERFGHSLPGTKAYDYFGFTVGRIAEKVLGFVEQFAEGSFGRGEFVEL